MSASRAVAVQPRCSRRALLGAAALLGPTFVHGSALAEPSLDALAATARSALAALDAWTSEQRGLLSAYVGDVESGRALAEVSAHTPLNPASNEKILTAAAVLDRLGPQYRFTTALYGRGSGEQAFSELVLRGNGDPELRLEDLAELVRRIKARGCERIVGDVFVDQSAFDDRWDPPGYEQHPDDWAAYRAPVSAVAIERNAVELHVLASHAGNPARVWFTPAGFVEAEGRIVTTERHTKPNLRFSMKRRGERTVAVVAGSVPEGAAELTMARRIADPALAAGRALLALLAEQRISVGGTLKLGGSEIREVITSLSSRPLSELLFALGKHSDNFVAEMLLKALGGAASSAPGSSAAGAAAVLQYLNRFGPLDPGTRISNGSGLFDANRASAALIANVLAAAYRDARIGPELIACLSIGGLDGTLGARLAAFRDARSVRAKTGTLASVIALSGLVLRSAPNQPLVFSILVNEVAGRQLEARHRIDEAVQAIARAA